MRDQRKMNFELDLLELLDSQPSSYTKLLQETNCNVTKSSNGDT